MVLEKVVEERIQAIPLEDFTYIVRAASASLPLAPLTSLPRRYAAKSSQKG